LIVVDASAAVFALLGDGDARRRLSVEQLAAPHLIDSEVASALRAQVKRKAITASQGQGALETWTRLGLERYAATGLLDRVWTLRDNLTTYDATYVALAEALECSLLSGDARLGAAPGPTCVISIVRR
jgi:predicted nucleic acid-binding protein